MASETENSAREWHRAQGRLQRERNDQNPPTHQQHNETRAASPTRVERVRGDGPRGSPADLDHQFDQNAHPGAQNPYGRPENQDLQKTRDITRAETGLEEVIEGVDQMDVGAPQQQARGAIPGAKITYPTAKGVGKEERYKFRERMNRALREIKDYQDQGILVIPKKVSACIPPKLLRVVCKRILKTGTPEETEEGLIEDFMFMRGAWKPKEIMGDIHTKVKQNQMDMSIPDAMDRVTKYIQTYDELLLKSNAKLEGKPAVRALLYGTSAPSD